MSTETPTEESDRPADGREHSDFPEHLFPPVRHRAHWYWQQVSQGRAHAAGSRAVICGLARDLGSRLVDQTIPAIETIGGLFGEYRVVIYENDSVDETPDCLLAWARANPRVTVMCERAGRKAWGAVRDGMRGQHLAEARNRYLDVVQNHLADWPYAIVLDTDIGQYSLDGIAHTLGSDQPWDAVASNGLARIKGRLVLYDAWAHRKYGSTAPMTAREVNPMVFGRGLPWVRVSSAFGGMAVYRTRALRAARYAGGDCEHVALHRGMSNVFMSPSQVVLYP